MAILETCAIYYVRCPCGWKSGNRPANLIMATLCAEDDPESAATIRRYKRFMDLIARHRAECDGLDAHFGLIPTIRAEVI